MNTSTKKLTAYQKLKLENKDLKKDISKLLGYGNYLEEVETKQKWKMIFDFENLIWGRKNGK